MVVKSHNKDFFTQSWLSTNDGRYVVGYLAKIRTALIGNYNTKVLNQ